MENFKNLQDEKTKPVTNPETFAHQEIITPEEKIGLPRTKFEPICNTRCIICNSKHSEEIFNMRKKGVEYDDIIKFVSENYGESFSRSSLSRHFANITKRELQIAAEIIHADIVDEAVAKSVHIQGVTKLITYAINVLSERMAAGTLPIDVETLDKLTKLRYVTLAGLDGGDNQNILAIYKRSLDKYGVAFEQGTLALGRPATTLAETQTQIPAAI